MKLTLLGLIFWNTWTSRPHLWAKFNRVPFIIWKMLKSWSFLEIALNGLTCSDLETYRNVGNWDLLQDSQFFSNFQKWLDLSHNRFKTLPKFEEESGVYIPLEYLDISNNPFTSIISKSLPDTILALNISCFMSRTFESNAVDNLHQLRELYKRFFLVTLVHHGNISLCCK